MKGYDYLKKALDGELKPKTIIMNKEFDNNYDYYIYGNDNMFHRCNKDGKLGAKYQDRFLNYKVLEKDFKFYCVLEEEKEIPEKLEIYKSDDETIIGLRESINIMFDDTASKINSIIDYLKSKGK